MESGPILSLLELEDAPMKPKSTSSAMKEVDGEGGVADMVVWEANHVKR